MGRGVRKLDLAAIAPDCEIVVDGMPYDLAALSRGKLVLDVGCGYGPLRSVVEGAGGKWIGIERFAGGGELISADAAALPIQTASVDVVVMDAVLEHIPDAPEAIAEVARVLKPGGKFVGYAAFMEAFHEISYSHLSFKALEFYATKNGMKLERISDAGRFGIDYHLAVTMYPVPSALVSSLVAAMMRGTFKVKRALSYQYLRRRRGLAASEAGDLAEKYYRVERLRQSIGYHFQIVRTAIED